jgi:hypothetical protein
MTADRNGVSIGVTRMNSGKWWAMIETLAGPAPWSFHDWYDMVQAICLCELLKYKGYRDLPTDRDIKPAEFWDEATWDRWTRLPRDFVMACFEYGATYEDLRIRFHLPR